MIRGESDTIEPQKINDLEDALKLLDEFLSRSLWVAGDQMTIADQSIVTVVSNIEVKKINYIWYIF